MNELHILWDPTGIRMVRHWPWWVRGLRLRAWYFRRFAFDPQETE